MSSIETIANVIPADVSLSEQERRAVLEIAYLSIAADHNIHQDEETALRRIARKLSSRGGAAKVEVAGADRSDGDAEVDRLLAEIGVRMARETADARLREVAAKLTTASAKALAYKAAYALSLSDLASSDEEFEFDLQLIDALSLSQDVVDELTDQVMQALQPE
jgi:hypothetical protein